MRLFSKRSLGARAGVVAAGRFAASTPPPKAAADDAVDKKPSASPQPSSTTPAARKLSVVSAKTTEALLLKGETREEIADAHRKHTEQWNKKYGDLRYRGWGTLLYEIAPTATTAAFALGGMTFGAVSGLPTWLNVLEFIAAFTASQRFIARGYPCPTEGLRDMKGKVCLVTGASSGMGVHVAAALLNAGAIVVATHNTVTADVTKAQILALASADVRERIEGEKKPSLVVWPLQLQDRNSIQKLVSSVKKHFPDGLDLLVNNAGNMLGDEYAASNGVEHTIDVSFLGPYALTESLLHHITRASGRIIYVSSHSHRIATTRDEPHKIVGRTLARPFTGTEDVWYHRYRTFSYAKFGNMCHAESLRRRGAKVVTVNPGKVNTNLRRVVFPFLGNRYYYPGVLWQLRTPEEGAQTTIYAALAPDDQLTWGGYYHNCARLKFGKSQFVDPAADAACEWAAQQTKVPVTKLHTFRKD